MAPVWILAVVFGLIGMRKKFKRGTAVAGLILGLLGAGYKPGFWLFLAGGLALASLSTQPAFDKDDNIFGKKTLAPATVDLIDDPNYQNVIFPEELKNTLDEEAPVTIYFYASDCVHCKRTTPTLAPLAETIDLVQYNLL